MADWKKVLTEQDLDTATTLGTSDVKVPSQLAVKTYVDAQVDTADALAEMADVTISSVGDHEVLAYDDATGEFINMTASEAGLQTTVAFGTSNGQTPKVITGLDANDAVNEDDFAVFTKDAGQTGEGLKGLSAQGVRTAISAHPSGGASSLDFDAKDLTVAGNLVVTGTTTSVSSANLEVEDKLVNLAVPDSAYGNDANGHTAAQTASDGGGIVLSSTYGTEPTHMARFTWSKTGKQSGWEVADSSAGGSASTAYTVQTISYSDNSTAPSADLNGIGGLHFDTGNDTLYVRVS